MKSEVQPMYEPEPGQAPDPGGAPTARQLEFLRDLRKTLGEKNRAVPANRKQASDWIKELKVRADELVEPTKKQITQIRRLRTILGIRKKKIPATKGKAGVELGRLYGLESTYHELKGLSDETLRHAARWIREFRKKKKEEIVKNDG